MSSERRSPRHVAVLEELEVGGRGDSPLPNGLQEAVRSPSFSPHESECESRPRVLGKQTGSPPLGSSASSGSAMRGKGRTKTFKGGGTGPAFSRLDDGGEDPRGGHDGDGVLALQMEQQQRPQGGGGTEMKLTFAVILAIGVACMTELLLGYDIGIMAGAMLFVKKDFELSAEQVEVAVGVLNFVATVGALLGGRLSDALGRRAVIGFAAVSFFAGAAMLAAAWNYSFFVAGRIVMGFGVGAGLTVPPMYVAEVTPAKHRGALSSLGEFFINVGILAGYVAAFCLRSLPQGIEWRVMLGVGTVPPVMILAGLLFLPESPRWLALAGRHEEALRSLERLTGSSAQAQEMLEGVGHSLNSPEVADAIEEEDDDDDDETDLPTVNSGARGGAVSNGIGEPSESPAVITPHTRTVLSGSASSSSQEGRRFRCWGLCKGRGVKVKLKFCKFKLGSKWKALVCPKSAGMRRRVAAAMGVALFVQLTGIEPVTYYATTILEEAGFREENGDVFLASVVMGSLKLAAVGVAIVFVDRAGRRPLLFLSFSVQSAALFLFAWLSVGDSPGYLRLSAICLFVIGFSLGAGPLVYTLPSELLPLRLRGIGVGLAMFLSRLVSSITSVTYLSLTDALGPVGVFSLFGVICLGALLFSATMVPETKGTSLEDIEDAASTVGGSHEYGDPGLGRSPPDSARGPPVYIQTMMESELERSRGFGQSHDGLSIQK